MPLWLAMSVPVFSARYRASHCLTDRFLCGGQVYAFDTFALAAISIVAANGAVSRGLHPLVVCTAGVTICFGGLIRDVMCGRNLAIGGQSYALATGAGATVFVALRELAIRGVALPLALRLVLAGGTVVGLRTLEKVRGSPLLQPMHAQVSSHP